MNTKLKRIAKGLTQKELAKLAGTCNVTIVKIEKGNVDTVSLGTLKRIAKILDSTVEELFLSDDLI